MLPQYAVALKVSRNCSKMAYLKRSKSRIVHLFSSFYFSQRCALTQEVTQPPTVREFPKDGYLVLSLKRNYIQSLSNVLPYWMPFSLSMLLLTG